ncbi:MAG: hypothetical protein JST05_09815 [Acidobacteria bacterium]|nr:hypothetical protein [Acidobacteriota bacterium]
MRALFLMVQAWVAWGLWAVMPARWGNRTKALALLFLWFEPTFRERSLEIRTDLPMVALVLTATWAWAAAGRGPRARLLPWAAWLCMSLAACLTPKTLLWALPWCLAAAAQRASVRERLRALWILAGLGAALAMAFLFVAWWTHRTPSGIFTEAMSQSGTAAMGSHHLFGHDTIYYLKQTFMLGAPFWVMAIWGLGAWSRGKVEIKDAWAHVLWTGIGAFLLSLFYASGFPYHWMAVAPFLLPAAAAGVEYLVQRFGPSAAQAWGVLVIAFLAVALLPVLAGPWRSQQEALWRCLEAYVGRDRGYVDGVGGLGRPQLAPFVTTMTIVAGGAEGLDRRWEAERLSGALLDEQGSLLLDEHNLGWMKSHLVLIQPQIAVLGTEGSHESRLDTAWHCPWPERFVFHGDASWSWTVAGEAIRDGQPFSVVKAGAIAIHGEGPGTGSYRITLRPYRDPGNPRELDLFFLPFQRLYHGWPGY